MTTALVRGTRRAVRLWLLATGGYLMVLGLAHLWLTFLPAFSEGVMLPSLW